MLARILFQFPSNGKVFPNCFTQKPRPGCLLVSIPFKREGLSERVDVRRAAAGNGNTVSIPFKREGLSEPVLHILVAYDEFY